MSAGLRGVTPRDPSAECDRDMTGKRRGGPGRLQRQVRRLIAPAAGHAEDRPRSARKTGRIFRRSVDMVADQRNGARNCSGGKGDRRAGRSADGCSRR